MVFLGAGCSQAEPETKAGVDNIPAPPGMIRVDGRDGAIEEKLSASAPQVRHLAIFVKAASWEDWKKASDSSVAEIMSLALIPKGMDGQTCTPEQFNELVKPELIQAEDNVNRILDDQPNFITLYRKNTREIVEKDPARHYYESVVSAVLIDGQVVALYTYNPNDFSQGDYPLNSHLAWRDEYLKNTGSGARGGKTDTQ
jgi:hypothetical protein